MSRSCRDLRTMKRPFSQATVSDCRARKAWRQAKYVTVRTSIHRRRNAPILVNVIAGYNAPLMDAPLTGQGRWEGVPDKNPIRLAILRQQHDHRVGCGGVAVGQRRREL